MMVTAQHGEISFMVCTMCTVQFMERLKVNNLQSSLKIVTRFSLKGELTVT